MAEYLITIKANDGTTQVFKAVADGAQKMGTELEKAGQKGKKGADDLDTFSKKAAAIGAAAGTAVSALSLLGQAALSQQQSIASLQRSYGDAADDILDFTERIQDSTKFSNDSARDAASLAATLANQYGLSTQQIEELLTRTADLAQQYGYTFEDAAARTTSAIRGEAESAEYLNLSLSDSVVAAYAAEQGITNYSTGLDQAGRAQVRYNLFLEQSVSAQGAAGEAADTAAGQATHLKNEFQDFGQSLGGLLGPVGEVASTLGILAIAAPALGAGLGGAATGVRALGVSMAAARVGSLGLLTVLGPVGIAAAAIGGVVALIALADSFDKVEQTTEGAANSIETVNEALYSLQDAGINSALLVQAENIRTGYDAAIEGLETYEELNSRRRDNLRDIEAVTAINAEIDALENLGATGETVAKILAEVSNPNINGGQLLADLNVQIQALASKQITLSQFTENINVMFSVLDEAYRIPVDLAGGFDILTYSILDGNDAANEFTTALDGIQQAAARFGTGEIQGVRDYIAALIEVRAAQLAAGNFDGATETTAVIDQATTYLKGALDARVAVVENGIAGVIEARAAGAAAERAELVSNRAELASEYQALIEQDRQFAEARAKSIGSLEDTYRDAAFQPLDIPFLDGLDEMVATGELTQAQADGITGSFDRLQASGASTLEIVDGLAEGFGYANSASIDLAAGVDRAASSLGEANDLIIGTTNNLSGLFDTTAGAVNDLFGESPDDGIGTLVDLLNAGVISAEEFNAARDAGLGILDDQLRAEESLNAIRALQLPYLEEQTAALADYLDMVEGLPEDEQRRVLYLQDAANQQNLLNTQTMLYAASIGELPTEFVTEAILSRAAWDPEYAAILEEQGVLKRNLNGEYRVTIPDAESTAEVLGNLTTAIEGLTDVIGDLASSFDPAIEKANILAGVDFSNIKNLGGPASALGASVAGMLAGLTGNGRPGDGITDYTPQYTAPFPEAGPASARPIQVPVEIRPGDLEEVIGTFETGITALGENSTVYLGTDNEEAIAAIEEATGAVYIYDEATGRSYLYVSDEASPGIHEGQELLKRVDGSSATLFALGDNSDALGKSSNAAGAFDGINGKSALLFANGDSSGAEQAASAGAAAVIGVDGTTANLFVQGNDNYSGVINAAGRYAGAVLATSYIDIVTREYKQNFASYFSNGGIVGYADGGIPAAANGMVMVGEAGPELVRLPGGSQVVPSPASQAIARQMRGDGAGQPLVFNNYGSINGIEDLAGFIYDGLAQAAAMERASQGGR